MAPTWQLDDLKAIARTPKSSNLLVHLGKTHVEISVPTNEFARWVHALRKMLEKRAALQPIFGTPALATLRTNPRKRPKFQNEIPSY